MGYGPQPEPCLELMAERAVALVGGNHEHGVAGLLDLDWFNPHARAALEWTQARLDDDHRRYLAALPLMAELGDATLVHASPAQPEDWDYLISADDGFDAFAGFRTRLCFVGHSHRPAVWSLGSWGPEFRPGGLDVAIDVGRRYIVNVGSVGQPRDRDCARRLRHLGRGGSPGRGASRRLRRGGGAREDRAGGAAQVPRRSPGQRRLTRVPSRGTLACAAAAVASGLALALAYPTLRSVGPRLGRAVPGDRHRGGAAPRAGLWLGLADRGRVLLRPAALAELHVLGLQRDPVAARLPSHPGPGRVLRPLRRPLRRAPWAGWPLVARPPGPLSSRPSSGWRGSGCGDTSWAGSRGACSDTRSTASCR